MILTADNCEKFISTIESLDGLDPFACRIISLCTSYNPHLPFVDYWTVFDDESNTATGAIARNGTDFILFLTDKTDIDEVSTFMRVAGAQESRQAFLSLKKEKPLRAIYEYYSGGK